MTQENLLPVVHVAVAVIVGDDGRILIARRPDDKHMGGYWEFPGGKVEGSESLEVALNRELKEELDIEAASFRKLIKIRHNYSDKTVVLDTWWASDLKGTPRGNEGQEIKWVEPETLRDIEFPPANGPIINAALLPTRYMVTGPFSSSAEVIEKVSRRLDDGVKLIQFRAPWLLRAESYYQVARELHHLCQQAGAKLMLKGRPELLQEPWCDGIHLRSDQLSIASEEWMRNRRLGQWLAASCHNQEQIEQAVRAGVDFVTLSPVRPTRSHPGRLAIGQEVAAELTADCPVPVYWLGGLNQSDEELVIDMGGQGISAIGAFWAAG